MFIKKLSANKDSFNTIEFKPCEFNIILGSRGKKDSKSSGDTVNGVGKSLSVKLIDYCLGSRHDAHKEINKLRGWEFELVLGNSKLNYIIKRDAETGHIKLNNQTKSTSELSNFLGAELFNHIEDYPFLSFRSLISRYLRIPKLAYLKWEQYKAKEDDFKSLVMNAYLLGLKLDLIINKGKYKDEINKIDKSKSYIQKDDTIKSVMNGSEVSIGINNLIKEIQILEKQLSNFKISEGYNDVKSEIEEYKFKKNDVINQITKYKNIIDNIDRNLDLNVDITSKKVEELYSEAKIVFPKEVLKSLDEVSLFHEKLIEGRKARLVKDKVFYKTKVEKLNKELGQLDKKINNNLEFIKDKVSISEYEKLQNRCTELKIQLEKAQQYEKLLKGFEHKKASKQADMAKDNLDAVKYIDDIKDYKNDLSKQFQRYVDYIYDESKYSGINISNNDGSNKIRYNIDVEIQDDNSDGIANVKIFCMDLLIWERQINNSVEFLYHDGVLFSDIDPRQCYRMLKLAYQVCKDKKFQYIFNMNYNMYDSIKKVAIDNKDEAFANYLDSCIRLKLYDDKPENKLLGVQI